MTLDAPIRVLLVDDEPLALRTVRRLVARDPDYTVVGSCRTGAEAIDAIRTHRPQLVLLDIEMAGGSGFDVVDAIGIETMPPLIFITAHASYTLQAFDVEALDYLLKPFSDDRFARTLSRAKVRLCERRASGHAAVARRTVDRFTIRSGDRLFFVRAEDVDWFEAEDYYTRLRIGRASHLIRQSLASLESTLDPRRFARIHRSTIVNLDRVRELRVSATSEYTVVLHDGTNLTVGRARRAAVRHALWRRV